MSELTKILLSASTETKRHTGLPRVMQLVANRVRSLNCDITLWMRKLKLREAK